MRRVGGARRSAEQWSQLIEEQARSGLSQRVFCEAHGLGHSSFAKAQARHRVPDVTEHSNEACEFVPTAVETVSARLLGYSLVPRRSHACGVDYVDTESQARQRRHRATDKAGLSTRAVVGVRRHVS